MTDLDSRIMELELENDLQESMNTYIARGHGTSRDVNPN